MFIAKYLSHEKSFPELEMPRALEMQMPAVRRGVVEQRETLLHMRH